MSLANLHLQFLPPARRQSMPIISKWQALWPALPTMCIVHENLELLNTVRAINFLGFGYITAVQIALLPQFER